MPKTLVGHNLGPPGTPQEVKDLRLSSFQFHEELGFPVVHKHRWNELDVREGRAKLCPLHDDLYDAAPARCAYCFGTGYLGGFSDGTIVYVTLKDTPQDTIRITPQGILQLDQHPQMTAPWLPEMGDGDLIILADFDPGTWEILDTHERYTLQRVSPFTMRGPGWGRRSSTTANRMRISQQSDADKLPFGHEWYDVPIVFNYNDAPSDVTPPGEVVPPEGYSYTEFIAGVHIVGAEQVGYHTEHSQEARVKVAGDNASTTAGVRITGESEGTVIIL